MVWNYRKEQEDNC